MLEVDAVASGTGTCVQYRKLNINPGDVEDALEETEEEGAVGGTETLGFDAACRFRLTQSWTFAAVISS